MGLFQSEAQRTHATSVRLYCGGEDGNRGSDTYLHSATHCVLQHYRLCFECGVSFIHLCLLQGLSLFHLFLGGVGLRGVGTSIPGASWIFLSLE